MFAITLSLAFFAFTSLASLVLAMIYDRDPAEHDARNLCITAAGLGVLTCAIIMISTGSL